MRLIRNTGESRRTRPPTPADTEMRSLRYWSLKPSGSPVDPLGNDLIVLDNSSTLRETVGTFISDYDGNDGISELE